jgi:hypothetical protein
MPRYFFYLHIDLDVPDDEGRDLLDLDAAREHALDEIRFTVSQHELMHSIVTVRPSRCASHFPREDYV